MVQDTIHHILSLYTVHAVYCIDLDLFTDLFYLRSNFVYIITFENPETIVLEAEPKCS